MSEADVDRAVRFSGALAKAFLYFSPLVNLAFFAVIAGILLLAFRLFGGEGNSKQAFSVTLYAWMPMVIAGIVSMIILVSRGTVDANELRNLVMSNPGFLVDMKDTTKLPGESLTTEDPDGNPWYRIVLGRFATDAEAQAAAQDLIGRSLIPEAIVMPYTPREP